MKSRSLLMKVDSRSVENLVNLNLSLLILMECCVITKASCGVVVSDDWETASSHGTCGR